jgi:hypothetical protein
MVGLIQLDLTLKYGCNVANCVFSRTFSLISTTSMLKLFQLKVLTSLVDDLILQDFDHSH